MRNTFVSCVRALSTPPEPHLNPDRPPLAITLTGMDETRFLTLADRYKKQIYTKLQELVPDRLGRLEPGVLTGRPTEAVLALIYMQGVAEALDAFDPAELWRAAQDDPGLTNVEA